ncbi:hypothetical protein V7138_04815 [Bacillus sp. JJ1533]|uniref:hypothetical protein n=1 Tax=Bacillus sp. JJ1533 TaxID=3122959 RepID=UPI002FFF4096
MESLVIAFISLLIVLPIIYFLPLGFTRKGKLLILICAFIVFIIGIAARTVMSVWQMGFVLILLAIGFSYLISKKFGTQLFLHTENSTGLDDKVIKFEIEDEVDEELRIQRQPENNQASIVEQERVSPQNETMEEELVEEIETDHQNKNDFVLEDVYVENEELENTYLIQTNEENPGTDFDNLLKEIELELKDNTSDIQDNNEIVEVPEKSDNIQTNETPETEDTDFNVEIPAPDDVQFDSLQVNSDEHSHEESEIDEVPMIEPIDSPLEEIEVDTAKEDDLKIEIENEEDVQIQMDSIDEFEEIEVEEEVIPVTKQNNESDIEHLRSEVVEYIDGESDVQERQDDPYNLSHQLFSTMISQIKLSRNKLSSTQYVKLIEDHLHPELNDHDYYTFVSLLIEHYLETKQYDELSVLVSQNEKRFEKYPVILQEIKFLLKEYCKV